MIISDCNNSNSSASRRLLDDADDDRALVCASTGLEPVPSRSESTLLPTKLTATVLLDRAADTVRHHHRHHSTICHFYWRFDYAKQRLPSSHWPSVLFVLSSRLSSCPPRQDWGAQSTGSKVGIRIFKTHEQSLGLTQESVSFMTPHRARLIFQMCRLNLLPVPSGCEFAGRKFGAHDKICATKQLATVLRPT